MANINLVLMVILIMGGIMLMTQKFRRQGIEFIKYCVIVYIIVKLAPIIYSYIDKLIR